jgi:hypothetical protein
MSFSINLDETGKTEVPCHSKCGSIKASPCSKGLSAEHRPKFCSPSPAMGSLVVVLLLSIWEVMSSSPARAGCIKPKTFEIGSDCSSCQEHGIQRFTYSVTWFRDIYRYLWRSPRRGTSSRPSYSDIRIM